MNQPLISIVIPAYNEAKNIPLAYEALRRVFADIPGYRYEFIFVNDGSSDETAETLAALAVMDPCVVNIEFSRNFGKESATTAGLDAATGDAVLMIDADLQHPPEYIPKFIEKWEDGAEVVTGLRTANQGEGFIKKWGSRLYYAVMNPISNVQMQAGETDFRLLDRIVVDAFKQLPERRRMTRALINWLGFKRDVVEFTAAARQHGEAGYSVRKLVHLAFYSVVSNSLFPLRLAGYFGVAITAASGFLGVVVFIERYILKDSFGWHVSGSAQLAVVNVFLIGIVLMALGLIALYIENIHTEVMERPLYVVRKKLKNRGLQEKTLE